MAVFVITCPISPPVKDCVKAEPLRSDKVMLSLPSSLLQAHPPPCCLSGPLRLSTYRTYLRSLCFHKGQRGLPQLIVHLSIRVAAATPPPSFFLLASLVIRMLPSPKLKGLGQWTLDFYEATSTFTLVTTRIFAHRPYDDFVDGLQKTTFPSPPAIQATWP